MPPRLDPNDPNDDVVASISAGESSRLRRRPVVLLSPTMDRVTIYCGAEDVLTSGDIFQSDYDEHRPWSVQILPEDPLPPPPRCKNSITRSNGCGAPVHYGARSVRRGQRWYGWKEGLASTVVPLDSVYFPLETTKSWGPMNGESECGCSTSGIGCAVCGNPLGARIMRCASHSVYAATPADRDVYTFLPSAVSPAISSDSNPSIPEMREPPTRPASLPLSDFPMPIARPPPPPPDSFPSFPSSTPDSDLTSNIPLFYIDPTPTPAAPHPPTRPITPTAARSWLQSTLTAPTVEEITPIHAPTPPRPAPRRRSTLRRTVSVERYFSGGAAEAGADAVFADMDAQAAADLWGGGGGEDSLTAQYNAVISAPGGGGWELLPAWFYDAAHAYSPTEDGSGEQMQEQRGTEGTADIDSRGGFYLPGLDLDTASASAITVDPDALRFASPATDAAADTEREIVFPDSPVQNIRVEPQFQDRETTPRPSDAHTMHRPGPDAVVRGARAVRAVGGEYRFGECDSRGIAHDE
ncbi:hypothetical protein B0H11DRAFT_543223 [Mycena galericulata]|nr:hypothetical protein B0H11DRAFT_543223 [Mycena galericulata]